MGTKDRERARKRHAILRARRGSDASAPDTDTDAAAGDQKAKGSAGRDRGKSGDRGRGGQGRQVNPLAAKGKIGDRDHRGRLRTRDMVVHPRISFFTLLGCFAVSLIGLFLQSRMPQLQLLIWVAYSVAFLALADLSRTKVHAFVCLVGGAFSFSLLVTQVSALVGG